MKKIKLFILISSMVLVHGRFTPLDFSGLDVRVFAFYTSFFLIYIYMFVKNKINIYKVNISNQANYLLLMFAIIFLGSVIQEGLTSTYFWGVIMTFTTVLVISKYMHLLRIDQVLSAIILVFVFTQIANFYLYVNEGNTLDFLNIGNRESRLQGMFGGGFAGVLGGLTNIMCLVLYNLRKKISVNILIPTIISWMTLFVTDNRTSMFACLFIYLAFFLYITKKNIFKKIIFIILLIISIIAINLYVNQTNRGGLIEEDLLMRNELWSFGVEQIFKNPIWGYGNQNPFEDHAMSKLLYDNIYDPHNAYLFFILKNGLFTMLILALVYIKMIKDVLRSKNEVKKSFLLIQAYWLIISITGGDYFNFDLNIGSLVFGITTIGLIYHPLGNINLLK